MRNPIVTIGGYHYVKGDRVEKGELDDIRQRCPNSCLSKHTLVKLASEEQKRVDKITGNQYLRLTFGTSYFVYGKSTSREKALEAHPDLTDREQVVKLLVSSHQTAKPAITPPIISFQ